MSAFEKNTNNNSDDSNDNSDNYNIIPESLKPSNKTDDCQQ